MSFIKLLQADSVVSGSLYINAVTNWWEIALLIIIIIAIVIYSKRKRRKLNRNS